MINENIALTLTDRETGEVILKTDNLSHESEETKLMVMNILKQYTLSKYIVEFD